MRRRARMVDLVRELAGGMDGAGGFDGVRVGVLGVAFKPNSDDIRDSPALDVARTVHDLGAVVTVYDPVAMSAARRAHPELRYADSAVGAAQDAEVMLLLTEWDEFCEADPEILARSSTSATSSTVATQSTQTAGGKSPGITAPSAARRQLWRYFAGRNIATSTGRHRHANGRPCTRSATRTSKPTPRRTSRCPVQTEVQPVYLIVESRLVDPASAFSSGVWQSGQSVPTRAPPRKTWFQSPSPLYFRPHRLHLIMAFLPDDRTCGARRLSRTAQPARVPSGYQRQPLAPPACACRAQRAEAQLATG